MEILNRLNNVQPKWHLLIGIIALILTVIGTIPLFHTDKPNLTIELISETNVIDINQPLNDLKILFAGHEILKENSNLRIVRVRIQNNGDKDITKNSYDEAVPFGFTIRDGNLLKIIPTEFSTRYLEENLGPKVVDNGVEFNKVMFDKDEYAIMDILILHKNNNAPQIIPNGKISGMREIKVVKREDAYIDVDKQQIKKLFDAFLRISGVILLLLPFRRALQKAGKEDMSHLVTLATYTMLLLWGIQAIGLLVPNLKISINL